MKRRYEVQPGIEVVLEHYRNRYGESCYRWGQDYRIEPMNEPDAPIERGWEIARLVKPSSNPVGYYKLLHYSASLKTAATLAYFNWIDLSAEVVA